MDTTALQPVAWWLLAAAALPWLAAILAKVGGSRYDNDNPRAWLARQEGRRARANAAQANLFEGLPFFFAAVLFALYRGADVGLLSTLMAAWVLIRLGYVLAYLAGLGLLRSLVWAAALAVNVAILFSQATV